MATRSTPAALCCCSDAALRIRTSATRARRTFSSTGARRKNGVLPIFYPTPLGPLTDLLNTIRSKIFIPSHLKHEQKKLIYKTSNHQLLRNDPFKVEIGPKGASEEILLEPIDRTKDVPDSWKAMRRALVLMSGTETGTAAGTEAGAVNGKDWENLIPLLEGMKTAGRRWRAWQWEYIARSAGEAGVAHILLDAARQPETTGLFLNDVRVVREVLWACRMKAVRDEWRLSSTTKALNYAEQVMRLMEDKRQSHEARRAVNKREAVEVVNPGKLPDVVGAVLELAACRAEALQSAETSGEEVDAAKNAVASYIGRLVPSLPKMRENVGSVALAPPPPAAAADYELLRWVPLMNGIQVAQGLFGGAIPEREALNRSLSQLEKTVTEAKETIVSNVGGDEGGKRRGYRWLEAMSTG